MTMWTLEGLEGLKIVRHGKVIGEEWVLVPGCQVLTSHVSFGGFILIKQINQLMRPLPLKDPISDAESNLLCYPFRTTNLIMSKKTDKAQKSNIKHRKTNY